MQEDTGGMPRRPEETALDWFERAIVSNRIAGDNLDQMLMTDTTYNEAAIKAIHHAAERAEADLLAARAAYVQQRRRDTKD